MSWAHIPVALQDTAQWCIAGPDKSPWSVNGHRASVTDPESWSDMVTVSTLAQQWGSGIGFVLSEDDEFTCIDLDVKDTTTAEELERYQHIISTFNSYTEFSKSGRGFHIWIRGKIGAGCRRDGVEVYSQQRFIICTGDVIHQAPIEDRQELLELLVEDMRRAAQSNHVALAEVAPTITDEEIWQKAVEAGNADKFNQLWEGNWQAMGYPSQSEADLALLSMLCFYTQSNEQVRRIFRYSALGQRSKAQKNNRYIDRTLSMIRGRQERENTQIEAVRAMATQLAQSIQFKAQAQQGAPVPMPTQIFGGAAQTPPAPVDDDSALDWPPGIIGRTAQWMYAIAPRPVKEVAIVGALGFFAGLCGKAYNVNRSGLNLYVILVARSAIGKEAMHTGISRLAKTMAPSCMQIEQHVDFADYASGPALVKSVVQRTSFVNVVSEFGRKLHRMSDDRGDGPTSSLRTAMTQIYQKSGIGSTVGGVTYSNSEKNASSTSAVAYSMIGESTPETFYESLTETMIADGFLSRFVVVGYDGLRPPLNPIQDLALPEDVGNTIMNLYAKICQTPLDGCNDVPMSREVQDMMDRFNEYCDAQINSTTDESKRQMWNRAHLKALKISALLAVADNGQAPCVQSYHAEWALKLVHLDITTMTRKTRDGDIGSGDVAREQKILALLREYLENPVSKGYNVSDAMRQQGIIPRKYLQARLSRTSSFTGHKMGHSIALDSALKSLTDSGYIVEVAKETVIADWGPSGKCYRIISLPEIV